MENKAKREYYLRSADFDGYRRLKPSAVLDLFQDIAGVHAEALGIGFESLYKRGLIWVLVRTKYEQFISPSRFSKVTLESWPLPPGRAGFGREYLIKNEKGETIIKGTSDWTVLDVVSRKIVPAGQIYPISEFIEERNFEEKTRRLPDFSGEEIFSLTARFAETDLNGHVNNTAYADYVLSTETLPADREISRFQIDYRKELLLGDEITLFSQAEENVYMYKGIRKDGETVFSAKIETK